MFISTVFDVRLQDPSIYWVPPTVSAAYNHLKIVWVNMHVVLHAIIADDVTKSVFQFWGNRVFACIHVSDFGMPESFGELCPGLVRDVVCLSDIQTPDMGFG